MNYYQYSDFFIKLEAAFRIEEHICILTWMVPLFCGSHLVDSLLFWHLLKVSCYLIFYLRFNGKICINKCIQQIERKETIRKHMMQTDQIHNLKGIDDFLEWSWWQNLGLYVVLDNMWENVERIDRIKLLRVLKVTG